MLLERGLFIFHRDYRIEDNIGLINACAKCKKLYTCFVFTPEQVGKQNQYRSKNAIQFMIESLDDLSKEISRHGGELMLFYGDYEKTIRQIITKLHIEALYWNKDYTPFAMKREQILMDLCKKANIEGQSFADYYLYEPGSVVSSSGTPFKKYTPFYHHVIHYAVEKPAYNCKTSSLCKGSAIDGRISVKQAFINFVSKMNPDIMIHGGRKLALDRLKMVGKTQRQYDTMRDYLEYETTFLSAYIKFGCVSVREVYHHIAKTFGKSSGIIRELIWREFFAHILYAYPDVLGQSYVEEYRKIKWRKSTRDFEKWKNGQTGFPIVDAGMRQLNATGYMHNRVRMMVASFLIKVLLLDWRLGEQYFAQQLTDYDIASNNGNWQGISGTGVDRKPYFRDMNPYIQSVKFDKDAVYIKRWVPELTEVAPADIHRWNETWNLEKYKSVDYPAPMTDYAEQKKKMMELYRNA